MARKTVSPPTPESKIPMGASELRISNCELRISGVSIPLHSLSVTRLLVANFEITIHNSQFTIHNSQFTIRNSFNVPSKACFAARSISLTGARVRRQPRLACPSGCRIRKPSRLLPCRVVQHPFQRHESRVRALKALQRQSRCRKCDRTTTLPTPELCRCDCRPRADPNAQRLRVSEALPWSAQALRVRQAAAPGFPLR